MEQLIQEGWFASVRRFGDITTIVVVTPFRRVAEDDVLKNGGWVIPVRITEVPEPKFPGSETEVK